MNIDRLPPRPSDKASDDVRALCDYLFYLIEKLNGEISNEEDD